MHFANNNRNFNGVVNSIKDFSVLVKQFVEVNSKEFINLLGRNVTWSKNELKASKAALIAGAAFVVGIVAVVVYKKCCAKKFANGALNGTAKKTAQVSDANLASKKSEEPKDKELATAKLAAEQTEKAEQAKKEASAVEAKANQAVEEKKAKEAMINDQKKEAHDKLEQTLVLLNETEAELIIQQQIAHIKWSAFIDYMIKENVSQKTTFIDLISTPYNREDAIAHFTTKKFLDSDGRVIVCDVALITTYLNLHFDCQDQYKITYAIDLKKFKLLKTKDELFMLITSLNKSNK